MAHLEINRIGSAQQPGALQLSTPRPWRPWSKEQLLLAAVGALFLLAWEGGVRAGWIPALYFPPPSLLGVTLWRLLVSGELGRHLFFTLRRLLAGFAAGALSGLVLGLGMGWSSGLRRFLDPLVAAIHPLPKIAIFPLLMIILGVGESSRVVVTAVAAFFPMLINAMAGVQQIRPIYFEVARSYGAGRRQMLRRVIWPASLPLVLAGARLALNVAWLVTIAVELMSSQRGLGSMIWLARETLHTEEIYVALVVISLLGILGNGLLQYLAYRLTPWRPERLT